MCSKVEVLLFENLQGQINLDKSFVIFSIPNPGETFLNNKNATLGDFLKKLWDAINEQCPMHNFVLRVDQEFTNIIQVIDLPITSKDLENLKERYRKEKEDLTKKLLEKNEEFDLNFNDIKKFDEEKKEILDHNKKLKKEVDDNFKKISEFKIIV